MIGRHDSMTSSVSQLFLTFSPLHRHRDHMARPRLQSSLFVDVKSQKTLKLIIIQKENQRFDIGERNMQEMESTRIFKSSRILRGECGIESFYFFLFGARGPK